MKKSLPGVRYFFRPLMVLVIASFFCLGAEGGAEGLWDKLKNAFVDSEEKELRPVEEVFKDAEDYRQGRETWYGKIVRKTYGAESKAYEKLPGVTRKNLPRAKELYREVVDNYPFSTYAVIAELRVADCHFHLEEYEEAAIWYDQFFKRHPRRDEVPHAMFQSGMCRFERIRKPGRDQDHTNLAAASFDLLIQRFPQSEYAARAREKLAECNKRLAEHEILVGDFYFRKKDYWAAAARYQGVWRRYSGMGFDDQTMFKEANCYERLGKTELALTRYREVIKGFPESEYGKKARDRAGKLEKR